MIVNNSQRFALSCMVTTLVLLGLDNSIEYHGNVVAYEVMDYVKDTYGGNPIVTLWKTI